MPKPLLMLVTVIALIGSSFAQNLGDTVTATFNAEDVQSRQGKLEIDPSSHTILRFYDEVTFAFSRRSDILKAINKGNDVLLYAMAEKAETDLSVLVEGKWHFFAVKIAKGAGLRFYEVKKSERPEANKPGDNNAVIQPGSSATIANSSASLVSPDWLKWNLVPIGKQPGEIRLSYTLENTGKDRVIVSEKGLRVLRDGKPLEFTLEGNGKQILDPGEVFTGMIRVKAPAGALRLQWSLRIMGLQESLVLEAGLK